MARWAVLLLVSGLLAAPAESGREGDSGKKPPAEQQHQEPPEEDEHLTAAKVYDFNPLQAEKELRIGDFYSRKGSWRAAAGRYREATRWNGDHATAWLKLAEASEKLKDTKTAREAYSRYLELEPQAKNAARIRRKLDEIK